MKVTRVGSATDTKSGRSEFTFRLVPCKHMKRNVWRAIQTHTGLSSSGEPISFIFLRRATETRKTIYGQIEFPFYGQSQKKMSVLLNAKSVFFMIRFVVEA